jgi:hypothetical protein
MSARCALPPIDGVIGRRSCGLLKILGAALQAGPQSRPQASALRPLYRAFLVKKFKQGSAALFCIASFFVRSDSLFDLKSVSSSRPWLRSHGAFTRHAPPQKDLVTLATQQCVPVLAKVRHRLTTCNRQPPNSQRRKLAQIPARTNSLSQARLSIPEFHSIANAMEIRFLFEPS